MTPLKPYQLVGAQTIHQFGGRALLADDQGLGKTLEALYFLYKTPQRRPCVIVTPASMKWTWHSEANQHLNMMTTVLEGHWNKKKKVDGKIIIINYDLLKSWLPALLDYQPACVILDEIHYCKSTTSQRTKAAFRLCAVADSVIGISGTPLTNRPIELWPVLHCIRPDLFPSRKEFAWRYTKPRFTPWGWNYDGASHLDELHAILREECMIRRMKKDVLPELPDKTRRVVSFKLKSYVEYNKAQTDFLTWLRSFSPARAQRAKKSQALTKVGYILRLIAKLKLPSTAEWIEEFFENHPGEKLMCLTMHTFVIDYLKNRFPKSLIIDGRVTGRKRVETIRMFQNNSRIPMLLGNWKAAGIGITLTAARHGVALDFPWTPGDLLQGEDRLHRIGQKKDVFIHYLVTLGTTEEKLIRVLQKKSKVLDAVLNGQAAEEDIDIFEELIDQLHKV